MEVSVNTLVEDLLRPTTEVTRAIAAVAQGNLTQTVRLDVDGRPLEGEFLRSANIVNTMIQQLGVFTAEVTRVAREVGTDGKLGGQAQVPGVAGTWKDLTDSVNSMASNLTGQVRNIAEVATAVASGDLSRKITVDVRGEILQLKEAINTMVDQLRSFASEVTRVAREVGTDGKLGGQAVVPGVAGTWKDLTDSVNAMAGNLTAQVRNIAEVTTAVARGDLSRKITVDVKGEILELKDTINTMVDQLNAFAGEVTRVAREVGTEGKLGGQAQVPGVGGTWKDLTDNVNFMASNLTGQVRNIAEVATAIASGDLSRKITVDVRGEILQLKETLNTMVDQLNRFAGEVTRVAREVGTEGRLGGQANVPGVAGTWKDLTDSVNSMAGNLTAQVRNIAEVTTAVARGDLSRKITVDVKGEILELKNTINTMVDQLNAFAGEVTRVAREVGTEGKLGGQAQVPGVAGTWKDLTDNVNFMASNLTGQVRNIAEVATAVARGDLSRKITVDVKGEILELKDTINTMVDQLRSFASEVTRVAREVGTDGKLGGQAQVPGVAGTWKDLTDSVNSMASNLTGQVRNIAEVSTAIASGDLSKKITVNVSGEILLLKETINTMVDQLNAFAGEVTRVAREVGTEGRLGGQANVPGVAGTWKDLTDSVNSMAGNLTGQVRNIAEVTTAVARGDLSRKITVDVKGEILELKNTINTMVDQLNAFAGEVTRVAREVGTEGKLGGQAEVPGVAGTWKDLTDNVNFMASNLTGQVRNIAEVATAIANGDLSKKITVDVRGEILQLKETLNTMVEQLRSFAAEVTRVAREVGTEGRLGGQANVPGVAGTWKDLTDSVNAMAGNLTGSGAQHRRGDDGRGARRLVAQDHGGREGRNSRAEEHHQHDGGPAQRLRRRSDARGARSRHRRQAGRPGAGARRGRHLEGPHRQRQRDGRQPDRAGARHREGGDRRRQRRAHAEADGERQGRSRGAGRNHQQHDRHAGHLCRSGDDRGSRSRRGRPPGRPGQRARRRRHVEGPHRQRQPAGRQPDQPGARHRRSRHRRHQGRPDAFDSSGSQRRSRRAERQHQHDDRQPAPHHRPQHRAGLAEDQPGALHRHVAGAARSDHRGPHVAVGAGAAGECAARRDLPDGGGRIGEHGACCRPLPTTDTTAIRERLQVGEGLVGQCAAEKRRMLITELPANTVPIRSGLFEAVPRNVIVLPVLFEDRVKAVIELASLSVFTASHLAFLEQLTASIGIVLNSIEATMQTEGLLKQSQQLATELQTQQKELQQTNEQLAQKAQQLAEQNVEVERKNQEIEQARRALEEKAKELALTSKYKSEFLANMSHELRTPLNSILVLGQQLSDNPDGNLTPKQVEFARTIHGAGTDLLNLISDILDLSKIESGTVSVEAEEVFFASLLDMVARPFRHEAENRQLTFDVHTDPHLDAQPGHRLEASAAGAEESAVQRLQVHRARRRAPVRFRRRKRLERGPSRSEQRGFGDCVRGRRHRHRHSAGEAANHLRGLPAGRCRHQPQVRRHGTGPGDQPRTGQPAGRRNPVAQHAGQGQHVHALLAADLCRAVQRRLSRLENESASVALGAAVVQR